MGINARYRHTSFGLRCLKAALGSYESQSAIVETTLKSDMTALGQELLAHRPRIVGIGVYIWNVPQAEQLVAYLKEVAPHVVVVLGGPEVSHETVGQPIVEAADYVVCGEGEDVFRDLVGALLAGRRPEAKIHDGGLPDLESLPSPYGLYSEEDIANRVVYVEASRGCPFTCQFCLSSLDKKVRMVPLDRFFSDLEILIERGARDFKFIDRTFNLKIDVSLRILHFFLEHVSLGLSLHFEMIPDRLPDPLRDALSQFPPGVVQLEVGIQTFDIPTAARIERRQNYDLTETNLRYLATETGVHLHTDLIVGLPGEDLKTFGVGFDRLIGMGPQEIQVGILKRLKGTPIHIHDGAEEMVYNPVAPFDVMQTRVLPALEAEEMKHFSRVWDRVANSGNFVEALPLLWDNQSSPFEAFRNFARRIVEKTGRSYGLSLILLNRLLLEYLVTDSGVEESRARETMHRDYHRTPGRKTPKFLHVLNPVSRVNLRENEVKLARQQRHLGSG